MKREERDSQIKLAMGMYPRDYNYINKDKTWLYYIYVFV